MERALGPLECMFFLVDFHKEGLGEEEDIGTYKLVLQQPSNDCLLVPSFY